MEGTSTDSLRALAPNWSLAGDDHLLSLLQDTHQKIISKCQDVDSKLEEMASALDDASIHLQNVNNKFMSLSNSQFIESRVYDDDEELMETQPVKEAPEPPPVDELSALKKSILVLEREHDTAEIMDDSDSDSDTEISLVLKPKDKYSHRPLPHIIGTQAWRNKWHAGLIVEDSDTDSSTSKQSRDVEIYSDSESDTAAPEIIRERTISETSSSLQSDRPTIPIPPPQKPADIAAELARRLGGQQVMEPNRQEYVAPVPTTRKVYKPEKPAASTIFSDEPPPLPEETYEPDTQSEDEDIFAEINKRKPYTQRSTVQPNLAEDLFSFDKPKIDEGDIFSDFATRETKPSAKQKSTLFQDESEPELFAEQPPKKDTALNNNNNIDKEEIHSKKPVGGISLFGTNKGAESIGAAILKRNQRKSSTSGDESGSDAIRNRKAEEKRKLVEKSEAVSKNETIDETDSKLKKEKDIFDDLFAKSEVKENKLAQKIVKEPVKDKEKKSVKDLFSDNIFDDIDDIFTSNIKIPPKESNQKSIFDDDDDLFSDIPKPKSNINEPKSSKYDQKGDSKNKNNLFNTDDDLFSDVKPADAKTKIESKVTESVKNDQNDLNKNYISEAIAKEENIVKSMATTKERNLFDDSPQIPKPEMKHQFKSKSIFDSDSDDDDDIFANVKISDKTSIETESVLNANKDNKVVDSNGKSELDDPQQLTTETEEKSNIIQSPALFEEEEIDDLFINANKLKAAENSAADAKIAEVKNVPSIAKDTVVVKDTVIVKDTVFEKDFVVVKETVITKDTTTTVNKFTLPEGNSSFVETKPNLTEHPILVPKHIPDADNSGDSLLEDGLFSSAKIPSKDISNKNDLNDIVTTEIIASNQEVNELTKEKIDRERKDEIKGTFKEDSVKTDPHFRDATSDVVRETEIIETHKQEEDLNQSIFDDFTVPVKEKDTLKTVYKRPVPNEADIFDDIFTEPPDFEKPAESKKSKNVNALFDDDSDDESMFFKKNDVISDEKPEIFSSNANFDIFVDEPPAIDVDFAAKSAPKIDQNDNDDLFSSVPKMAEYVPKSTQDLDFLDDDEDLFDSLPKMQETVSEKVIPETKVTNTIDTPIITNVPATEVHNNSQVQDVEERIFHTLDTKKYTAVDKTEEKVINTLSMGDIDSDDDLFSSLPKPNKPKSSQTNKTVEQNKTSKPSIVETQKPVDDSDDIFKPKESPSKKIGKLNTKNFNINVNALIPGASPKKVPKELKNEQNTYNQDLDTPKIKLFPTADEIDFQPRSPSNKIENDNSNVVIEPKDVKTVAFEEKAESEVLDNKASKQRARIQVKRRPSSRRARHEAVRKSAIDLYDDTDNSSSFDEPIKSKNKDPQSVKPVEKDTDMLNQNDSKVDEPDETQTEVNTSETLVETSANSNTKALVDTKRDQSEIVPSISSEIDAATKQNFNEQKTSTTKVVYILNDEDIFDTGSRNTEKVKENIFGNINAKTDDDVFGEKDTKTKDDDVFRTKNIKAKDIGDLFGSKKTETKEDDDLFGTKNVETADDDIFKSIQGVKTLGQTYKDHTEKTTDVTKKDENVIHNAIANLKNDDNNITKGVKSSLNVKTSLFEDSDEELFNNKKKVVKKTTIFDSDSEEDLFSGKKRTEKQNKEQKNKEVKERKEVIVKKSLFGDDDDDDLFGTKMEKTEPKIQPSKPSTSKETGIASKTGEPVFDDPLSMLGDDD